MNPQLVSELLKVRTTRTAAGVLAGLLGVTLVATALHSFGLPLDDVAGREGQLKVFIDVGSNLGMLFAALSGAMSFTNEIRHGTIRPTLLATPRRLRVVGAKAVVVLANGAAIGAVAAGAVAGSGRLFLHVRGVEFALSGRDVVTLVGGGAMAAALWSVIGLGVGAVVRSQVPTIVGLFVWVLFVENILLASFPAVGKFSPGALGRQLAGRTTDAVSSTAIASIVLATFAVAAIVAGALTTNRRDFT